jgi:hypothetical protein
MVGSRKVIAFAEGEPRQSQLWWPEQVDLSPVRHHAAESNPLGEDFDYAKAFLSLDLKVVKQDIAKVLTTSQDWWPADYGNYGPFFIRMGWHGAARSLSVIRARTLRNESCKYCIALEHTARLPYVSRVAPLVAKGGQFRARRPLPSFSSR